MVFVARESHGEVAYPRLSSGQLPLQLLFPPLGSVWDWILPEGTVVSRRNRTPRSETRKGYAGFDIEYETETLEAVVKTAQRWKEFLQQRWTVRLVRTH